MSCWTVLGLSADADVRTIKRQYAVLLKQTRPDDDPEGFQRLRDAYEQALAYKEWQQYHEQNQDEEQEQAQDQRIEESWDLSGLTVVEVDALQLATRSLHGLSVEELNHRHTVAREQGCAHIFEDTVLHHCIEHPDCSDSLVDWAVQAFQWFSAWQRLELDEESIELVLTWQRDRIAQPMRDALKREDVDGFLQAYARCADFHWLTTEQHQKWFNHALSHLLLDSSFWSGEIFERVRAGQGWHGCTGNPCPDGEWQRLLARQNAPLFLAHQQQLATEPAATPEHRAARLLLGTGSFSARRALARRLREDDWAQCRKLSSELYANHPKVCAQMPGGTAFFWQSWELSFNDWPTYVGVVLACLIGAFTHYIPLGVRLSGLINIVLISTVVFGVIVAGLNWLVHNVAHRVWRLDDRLSAVLCPRIPQRLAAVRRVARPGARRVDGGRAQLVFRPDCRRGVCLDPGDLRTGAPLAVQATGVLGREPTCRESRRDDPRNLGFSHRARRIQSGRQPRHGQSQSGPATLDRTFVQPLAGHHRRMQRTSHR
ncbi:J domain-containing protein [Pseudomonas sp. DR 5-09]|uniref:J domain-containing protein n=1 Tax=Pseudomonas sp. DR 5-09 TaxID=1534110 RepID=UPI0007DD5055|nr:J domain-containing protein [Pseudomonas sp. DR 5-09]ANI54466.1 molecular chaperone DnaJ [Pseudomonas sp. DR 5-09]